MRNESKLDIAAALIVGVVALQVYLVWQVYVLDALEVFQEVPLWAGLNTLAFAAVLYIYLKLFIGMQAFRRGRPRPSEDKK